MTMEERLGFLGGRSVSLGGLTAGVGTVVEEEVWLESG